MRRILTIDGGGIKGVFPAAFLATLEDELGGPVADYFDLIAGTSTGGIIAIGLGLGMTAKELLHLYREAGGRIFARRRVTRKSPPSSAWAAVAPRQTMMAGASAAISASSQGWQAAISRAPGLE